MIRVPLVVLSLVLGGVQLSAAAESTVSETSDFEAFVEAFCAADRAREHIFVLPMEGFMDADEIACPEGTSTPRTAEPTDDPGHVVLNVDPPEGVADALDCDGKADIGMTMVAINCLPASAETAEHKKP
jgi:hypothetical protein